MNISDAFNNTKLTENGDLAFVSTGDKYVDLLFFADFYTNHLDDVSIDDCEKSKIFSMMMRDPRFGLGYRDYGRKLLQLCGATPEEIVKCGRYDDLLFDMNNMDNINYLYEKIKSGDMLAKKWAPRFGSSNKVLASKLAKMFGLSKQQYNKLVKVETTESLLTEKNTDKINFSQVPSLASIKYASRFAKGDDTAERYAKWVEDVKSGKSKVNVSVTNCYDIYRHRNDDGFDPDMFFDKLEKINISCIPIVDTSGSMTFYECDAYGKAVSIGHYLSKCSTYMNGRVISFSSHPELLSLDNDNKKFNQNTKSFKSKYSKEIARMYTGDCTNTDFGAVMNILKQVDEFPEYLVVLSDMEFDMGSNQSKKELYDIWKKNNCNTKIVWWNLNGRSKTAPEMTGDGNIYMSGWSPMLLKYLESGFDGKMFIDKLITEYKKHI